MFTNLLQFVFFIERKRVKMILCFLETNSWRQNARFRISPFRNDVTQKFDHAIHVCWTIRAFLWHHEIFFDILWCSNVRFIFYASETAKGRVSLRGHHQGLWLFIHDDVLDPTIATIQIWRKCSFVSENDNHNYWDTDSRGRNTLINSDHVKTEYASWTSQLQILSRNSERWLQS